MLSAFIFDKTKDIIFIVILFIIHFKALFSKILDNFILKENLDTGDLIYVKDYHNLNIAITRKNTIYAGFPPTSKANLSASVTKYTNGITINNNFVLITCLSDFILKKINLKTGRTSNVVTMYYDPNGLTKSCSIGLLGNSAFVISSTISSNRVTTLISQYDLENINDETNGPTYTNTFIIGGNSNAHSFSYNSIEEIDQQADVESISVYGNITDIHLIFFYVNPINNEDGTITYRIMARFENKNYRLFNSTIKTDIKALKLNYYSIRLIIKYKKMDLYIKKEDSGYKFYSEKGKKNFEEEFISHNNSLIFTASRDFLKIEKLNCQNYYLFSLKSSIIKILGMYNETTDYVVYYYQTENSLNYISFQNSSFYFQVQAQSSNYIKKYNNNLVVNINKLIIPNDDYGNINLSNILYEDGNITKDYYTYNELSKDLTIFENPTDPQTKAIFLFNSLYEKQSNTDINLYIQPPLNVTITFEGCSFFCNLCFYHYMDCDLQKCESNYAFMNDTNDCYPNNQLFKKYIYNSTTKYFEKCYKTCDFCSLMSSESSKQKHNCFSCAEEYLRSYEYIGNCYKINNNEISSDKIIKNINDESFTIVQSCIDTDKKLKINSTGECVSQCPQLNGYKKYIYNYTNFTSNDYNPNNPQYQEIEEILPKYNLGDLCLESCPPDYEEDEENNICICIGESCKEKNLCGTNEKRFYLEDKGEFTENACSNDYYRFYFDCYIDGCPSNTSIAKMATKTCESNLNYCYIDNCFHSHCFLEPINEYIYRIDNSKQYLKSCNESLNYTIDNIKTYLYQNVCHSLCPENTEADEDNLICNCKYYKYSDNYDFAYNFICFSELEKCRTYIPVVDLKICLNTINDCIIENYKIFNKECYSKVCPENTQIIDDTLNCTCSYYFYNDSNYLNCLPQYASCQSYLYYYNNPYTKECFSSIEDCVIKGNIYIFRDNCYKNSCPSGTAIINENPNLSYYICDIIYDIPYIITETGLTMSYCPPIEILENICRIN